MFILLILGYALLGVYELVPLYKQKYWRDFWVVALLGLLSVILFLLLCFNVKLQSPEQPIKEFITSIFGK
jgi:uncharacterized membrane protein HdeD (DUF308 family)